MSKEPKSQTMWIAWHRQTETFELRFVDKVKDFVERRLKHEYGEDKFDKLWEVVEAQITEIQPKKRGKDDNAR